VFGLSIDVGALDSVGWLVALALVLTVFAKLVSGYGAGVVGGFSPRQSLNVGAALVAHGEFTIILAQIAADNDAISSGDRKDFVAFAGLYVLGTATLGVILMKESKRIGRRLFPPRLA
jgi:K+:H+ antiporter subunit KhtU